MRTIGLVTVVDMAEGNGWRYPSSIWMRQAFCIFMMSFKRFIYERLFAA